SPPPGRPGTAGADRRRSARLGPERRVRSPRPRQTAPRHLGSLAHRPLTGYGVPARTRSPVVGDTGRVPDEQAAHSPGIIERVSEDHIAPAALAGAMRQREWSL